jgi:MinD superfamily P-loop ATPase
LKIAVLSGKGGTGKTFVSVNLAYSVKYASYVDCDVEEPNGNLYFKGDFSEEEVFVEIPVIDHDKCTLCNKCSEFCKFNALALIIDKVRVFPQLCHSCGGCKLVCPTGAISEKLKPIGFIREGLFDEHKIISGVMNIKEETGVKIIDKIIDKTKDLKGTVVIDCPPGNGCSVMASIKEADYCLLVAEPTIFGLANLQMVSELTKVFNKPTGIVINKASGDKIINKFADEAKINIIAEIPFDKKMGLLNSNGEIVSKNKEFKKIFDDIYSKILEDLK